MPHDHAPIHPAVPAQRRRSGARTLAGPERPAGLHLPQIPVRRPGLAPVRGHHRAARIRPDPNRGQVDAIAQRRHGAALAPRRLLDRLGCRQLRKGRAFARPHECRALCGCGHFGRLCAPSPGCAATTAPRLAHGGTGRGLFGWPQFARGLGLGPGPAARAVLPGFEHRQFHTRASAGLFAKPAPSVRNGSRQWLADRGGLAQRPRRTRSRLRRRVGRHRCF